MLVVKMLKNHGFSFSPLIVGDNMFKENDMWYVVSRGAALHCN